jgi:hypothetical protein
MQRHRGARCWPKWIVMRPSHVCGGRAQGETASEGTKNKLKTPCQTKQLIFSGDDAIFQRHTDPLRDWHATLELVSVSVTPVAQRSPVSWPHVAVEIKIAQDSTGDSCVVVSLPILGHLMNELLAKFTRKLNIKHSAHKLKL